MSFLPSAAIGASGYCRHFMHPECPKWHYYSNSLRISAIGLKFVWIIHSTMKQIANWMLCTAIFASFMELWSFHDRLGTGVGDDGATLTLQRFELSAWNLVGWCTAPSRRLLYTMAMLVCFCASTGLHFLISARRGCCHSLNVALCYAGWLLIPTLLSL